MDIRKADILLTAARHETNSLIFVLDSAISALKGGRPLPPEWDVGFLERQLKRLHGVSDTILLAKKEIGSR